MNTKPQNSSPLLEVRDLCLSFHKQKQLAIDHVSFSIKAGSTLGLVGASGAGKSSIARAIMHLARPQSGAILFKGENILDMDKQRLMTSRQNMQIVFQEPSASLSPRRRVEQTLLEPLNHFRIGDSHSRQARIRDILQTVGLESDVLQRYPHQFSSGQQQRIAIARALVTEPQLLIADEAVSSLDVSIQAQILQLLQSLQKDLGISLLFISHDLAVVHQLADEVAVMYRGQLLEKAPASTFFNQPAHPYSQALLAFSDYQSALNVNAGQWRLHRGRETSSQSTRCLFLADCTKKNSICEQIEPESHTIQHENGHTLSSQCVKCHLYDEAEKNETIKAPE
jgi:ABC-type oligopeptide transport system ATPase subunit